MFVLLIYLVFNKTTKQFYIEMYRWERRFGFFGSFGPSK